MCVCVVFMQVGEFIDFLTTGQPSAPHYFSHDVGTNIVRLL